MASRRAEPARREEDVKESFATSALLGILSQSVDGAPSVAVATAAPSNDTPKSLDHGIVLPRYKPYTPLGAAVTSSGGPIQVLRMLLTRVLTHRVTPDSLSLSLALFLPHSLSLALSTSTSTINPTPQTLNPEPQSQTRCTTSCATAARSQLCLPWVD